MRKTFVIAIIVLFVVLSAVFYWVKTTAPEYNFVVLMWGNVIMATLSMITFFMVTKQMRSKPDAFVRGVYASSFLKLFVCVISVMVYAIVNKPNVHKPSLFILFGVYAAYTAVETWLLSRLAREVK